MIAVSLTGRVAVVAVDLAEAGGGTGSRRTSKWGDLPWPGSDE